MYQAKHSLYYGFIILCLSLALCSKGQSNTLSSPSFAIAKDQKQATLVIVYNGVEDFAAKNSSDEVDGFLVELVNDFGRYLSSQYGISTTVRFVQIPANSFNLFMQTMLHSEGGVFGLSNVSITQQRQTNYSFSVPYLENVSVLISNKATSTISSLSEMGGAFDGMVAYTVKASTYLQRLEQLRDLHMPEMQIEFVESGQDVIQQIADEPDSFGVADLLYYLNFYSKGYEVKRHPAGDLKNDQFGILLPKDSDWQPVLNEFLEGYISSETYRRHVTTFLGKSATRLIPQHHSN